MQATVRDIRVEASFRRRIQRTVAVLWDGTGEISATWFGRRFIERRLRVGQEIVVSGRLKRFRGALTVDNPEFQSVDAAGEVLMAGRIVPVYRLTAGLTAARLRVAEREALDERNGIKGFIGASAGMRAVCDRIEAAGRSPATVLITGESGTGKELVARAIHHKSARRDKPFVPVNCAALPENLIESELFGHEPGSFTGATKEGLGLFRAALHKCGPD